MPSGEPRILSSSFVGILIPGQIFWKDAKIVDRRFSRMLPMRKNVSRGFIFESKRCFRFNHFLRSFRTDL